MNRPRLSVSKSLLRRGFRFLPVAMMAALFLQASAFALDAVPEPIKRAPPVYPRNMKDSGMVGEVVVQFIVNKSGDVVGPTIVRSNNPGFEQAAIDAVLKWKFRPGRRNGVPVSTRMQIPLRFSLDDVEGIEAYTAAQPSKKDMTKMPEGFRYDVAPKPRSVIYPVYPYEQLKNNTKGSATVAVLVSAEAKVMGMQVVEQSAPEFGLAALAACEYFEFDAATLQGRPTDAIISVALEFNGNSNFVTRDDRNMLRVEKKSPAKIVPAKKLDAVPKMIAARKAPFPLAAQLEKLNSGEATVEFYIDTEGNVRLPRIKSCTHPSFGYIAVQTAANWRFAPPMSGGKPVITRAQIPIKFSLKDASPDML
ncbi:MAG: energy transducer TonB [Opitutaceae bacterium]|jgi:TonB family protein|nr:energy transducer TonB [Opitutaceae bacterium]